MSKKASMNALTYDVTPWTGPVLTKHARKRCTQRHINPLHVGVDSSTKAIVSNNVVLTVYKRTHREYRAKGEHSIEQGLQGHRRTRSDYWGPVIDGEQYMRKTNKPHNVPEDVAIHLNKYSDRSTKFTERTSYTKKEKKKKTKKTKKAVKLTKKARKRMEKRRATKGLRNRL